MKADGAAALVEFNLERNLAAKRTALLWVDFDVDMHTSRSNTWIESVARRAGGHRRFRFEVRQRSGEGGLYS